MPLDRANDGVVQHRCPLHGHRCIGYARSHQPPTNALDFIDRLVVLITSGHCTKAMALSAVAVLAAFVVLVVTIAILAPWGLLTIFAGPGYIAYKMRRAIRDLRRNSEPPSTETELGKRHV